MAVSNVYRIMLLGLLPVVALLIYYKGQHYDPALINFSLSQSSNNSMSGFFPPAIDTLSRSGQIRTYTKDNLYEYVNGHAEYFISSGFVNLAVGEYSIKTAAEPDIVVDIYDMGKGIHAFGILSDESGGNATDIHAGMTGFKTPQGLSFIKGQYYIKISSFSSSVVLETFIEDIDNRISAGADPFPEFAQLPEIGETVSTRFIKEAYRGLDFVNNVMEREYNVNGKTVHVFILTQDKLQTNEKINLFINYFNDSDITFTESKENEKTIYNVSDPYEGDWLLISSLDSIMGILGAYNDTIIKTIIDNTTDSREPSYTSSPLKGEY